MFENRLFLVGFSFFMIKIEIKLFFGLTLMIKF